MILVVQFHWRDPKRLEIIRLLITEAINWRCFFWALIGKMLNHACYHLNISRVSRAELLNIKWLLYAQIWLLARKNLRVKGRTFYLGVLNCPASIPFRICTVFSASYVKSILFHVVYRNNTTVYSQFSAYPPNTLCFPTGKSSNFSTSLKWGAQRCWLFLHRNWKIS